MAATSMRHGAASLPPYPGLARDALAPLRVLVTGAAGFVGQRLVLALLKHGALRVRMFDWRPAPLPPSSLCSEAELARVEAMQGDLRRDTDVYSALRDMDAVMHVASFGMGGREMMSQAHKLFDINVGGTRRLLELGVQLGIRFFVYTSTVNVVFGGDHPPAIINGREDMPYCPLERHCDDYARTKSLAEQAVLAMDRQGGPLRTCAVRPNAIYGEGEERHLPRILWYAERGLLQFKVGSPSSLQDWVHVDNLCLGELLALRSLATPECRAGGRAFNISDGSPVNTNKFVGTIVERVGFVQRDLWLPYSLVFAMGRGVELAYRLVHRCYDFDPVLIRSEVNKTALTHWFSLEAARRDLGYKPMFDTSVGLERTASWFAANYRPTSAAYWRRLKVFALACATLLAAWAAATLANRTW